MAHPYDRIGYDLDDLKACAQLLGLTPREHRVLSLTVIHTERGFFDPVIKPEQFAELMAHVVYQADTLSLQIDIESVPGPVITLYDDYTKIILSQIVGQPCNARSMIVLYIKAGAQIWRDLQQGRSENEQVPT